MSKKVLVGISGGIDSFVTVVMLQEQGYDVTGVCFDFWKANDLTIVQKMCNALHVPLIRRSERDIFKQLVVDSFIEDYINARTPSPCCVCNSYVKWVLLSKLSDELGIANIATGHYVNIKCENGHYYIYRGVDEVKDQSYFLWAINQEILAKSITPLGNFTKQQVRQFAFKKGYREILERKESMSVCFLRGRDYRDFIAEYAGVKNSPGNIYLEDGTLIGEHDGLLNYTVGQKRGIPSVNGVPQYVSSMNAAQNSLLVATKERLNSLQFKLTKLNIVNQDDLKLPHLSVCVRGLGLNPKGYAKVKMLDNDELDVQLENPAWAMAQGQPVVIYARDRIIGGGVVK